jgi:hypothetical protein
MISRHAIGRADLLRALLGRDQEAETRLARVLGFHAHPVPDASPKPLSSRVEALEAQDKPAETVPAPEVEPTPRRPPLEAKFFALLGSETVEEVQEAPPDRQALQPLTIADCLPRKSGAPPFHPLVARTRLWPAVKKSLAEPRLAGKRRNARPSGWKRS